MPPRTIEVDGQRWEVAPTGRVTQYTRDEFGLIFTRANGPRREERVVRYSPTGTRCPEDALAEMPEYQLRQLLTRSQPSWTAAETGYRR
jgi:hypothetical protein